MEGREGHSSGIATGGRYTLPPTRLASEDILFCIDVDPESLIEMKNTSVSGRPFTRLESFKQAILLFIDAKLSINPDHRFAYSALGKTPFWLKKEFTSEVDSAMAAFRAITVDSSAAHADLTHLFKVANHEAKKSRAQNRILRVMETISAIETTGGDYSCRKMGCIDYFNQGCPEELKLLGEGVCDRSCQRSRARCGGANGYIVKFCPPSDTFSMIKVGSQLKQNEQLVSIGKNFTLGFFGTDYSYLGTWYTNDVKSRKVWVANRNFPIISTSGTHALFIDPNSGNLIIVDEDKTLMRITDFDTGSNPNVTATLEDNGNFRLINKNDNRVLWQSFDHPTNVLLPGMKLGYDITKGQNWTLTSWLSNEIPDTGAFTLSWEPIDEASQRLIIRRRGQPYWTSGNQNNQPFEYMWSMNGPFYYQKTSAYNNEEGYFTYNNFYHRDFPM